MFVNINVYHCLSTPINHQRLSILINLWLSHDSSGWVMVDILKFIVNISLLMSLNSSVMSTITSLVMFLHPGHLLPPYIYRVDQLLATSIYIQGVCHVTWPPGTLMYMPPGTQGVSGPCCHLVYTGEWSWHLVARVCHRAMRVMGMPDRNYTCLSRTKHAGPQPRESLTQRSVIIVTVYLPPWYGTYKVPTTLLSVHQGTYYPHKVPSTHITFTKGIDRALIAHIGHWYYTDMVGITLLSLREGTYYPHKVPSPCARVVYHSDRTHNTLIRVPITLNKVPSPCARVVYHSDRVHNTPISLPQEDSYPLDTMLTPYQTPRYSTFIVPNTLISWLIRYQPHRYSTFIVPNTLIPCRNYVNTILNTLIPCKHHR
ncbi:hypothetical protein TOT_040000895 [Theileria orientalis strain Shintoku]|uniref:Uncharacterized protein n=1 Tax=Theileria orientalis strain Shintoku TaxID=869250 RepID=J7MH42_THEOR|nr:hypothetical protein TOT_040000895 [Theileria orientalis strain Shintoku]BAM42526.1 hypothetical protein TOT_040000895 [Theileria orientalis strain Shintoku]|eukprot:XP_009692827.1 hypothetical protein TOT_040000895 [Theileria orientalis strain Shintoku]